MAIPFAEAPSPYGNFTALNVTAATVIKAIPGAVITVHILVAGSAAGAIYDSVSLAGNSVANQVCIIPNALGPPISVSFPCLNGIVVAPGAGQAVSVSYS